jgi:hypothetical protein
LFPLPTTAKVTAKTAVTAKTTIALFFNNIIMVTFSGQWRPLLVGLLEDTFGNVHIQY